MIRGFIFKCSNKTESECLERSLFGADRLAGDEVLTLQPGDKLFLLNVQSDTLTGVFQAMTKGVLNRVPEAWRGRYPYQVAIQPVGQTRVVGKAKETLAALRLNSHQPLHEFEANVLTTLLSFGREQSRLLDVQEPSPVVIPPTLMKRLARGIEEFRKTNGLNHLEHEKPPLESTTLWDYPTQGYGRTPKGNNKYAGVTPAFIIWNLLKRYTSSDDLVVDPMCGSGTTIDVCQEEGRRVKGYDIVSVRPDIIENDARSLPLPDDSVDLVFIDSPYGDNIKYNASPRNIGNISAESEEFYDELEKVMKETHRVLKPGKVLGWLIGDQWVKKRFTPVGFKVYERLTNYFEPMDIICVVRRSQSSNTSVWHNRARRFNFFLRGFKYLIIVRKPAQEPEPGGPSRAVTWAYYDRGRRRSEGPGVAEQ